MENIVYTTESCPYCIRVKNLLNDLGVPFEERLIKTKEERQALVEKYNFRTVPLVILNGRFIGGFDDTDALVKSGKLDEVLGKK